MNIFKKLIMVFCLMLLPSLAVAGSDDWAFDNNGNWWDDYDWYLGAAPGSTSIRNSTDTASFDVTGDGTLGGDRTVTLDANRNIGTISWSSSWNYKFTLTGGSLLLSSGGGIIEQGTGIRINTIASPITLWGSPGTNTWTANGSKTNNTLLISGTVTGMAGTGKISILNLAGTNIGPNTISGLIGNGSSNGVLSITKSGASLWVLSGTNTYTGTNTVSGGTLRAGSTPTAFGNSAGMSLANTAGVKVDLNNFTTRIGSLSGGGSTGGNLTLGSGTLVIVENSTNTYTGSISGTGGLTKLGTGKTILAGTNTYTGATIIGGGILAAGTSTVAGVSGAFGINSSMTISNVAGATLDITGYNNQIGILSGGGSTGGSITLGAATLTINDAGVTTNTFAGIISGSGGSLSKIGSGELVLSTNNTFTGGITITNGVLTLGDPDAFGTGTVTMGNGSTLRQITFEGTITPNIPNPFVLSGGMITMIDTFSTGKDITITNAISGAGGIKLISDSSGRWIELKGNNTFSGGITMLGASTYPSLQFNNTNSLGSGPITMAVSGTDLTRSWFKATADVNTGNGITNSIIISNACRMIVAGNFDTTLSGTISGGGLLYKTNSGILQLAGNSTYTNSTFVNGGTLQLGGDGSGTVNFDTDNTMQGWDTVMPGTAGFQVFMITNGVGGGESVLAQSSPYYVTGVPDGNRDNAHGTMYVRSPPFVLGSGDLTFYLAGGTGVTTNWPTNVTGVATNSSGTGFMGVALRRVSDNAFVAITNKSSTGTAWAQRTFTAAQLSSYVGDVFTLDLIDQFHGGWGWICLDSISIPGTIYGPLGTADAGTTMQLGGVLDLNGQSLTTGEPLTFSSYGILTNSSSTNATCNSPITLVGGGNSIISDNGDITLSGAIAFGNSTWNMGGTATNCVISGVIGNSGSGTINKYGTGTWTLSGQNTHTANLNIYGGTVKAGCTAGSYYDGPWGNYNSRVIVYSGACVDMAGYSVPYDAGLPGYQPYTLLGTGISGAGAMINSGTSVSTNGGQITLEADATITAGTGSMVFSNGAGTATFTGAYNLTLDGTTTGNRIDGTIGTSTGGLIKNGTGTWTLSTNNTFSGTVQVNAGSLIASANSSLGISTNIVVSSGGILWTYGTSITNTATVSINSSFGVNSKIAITNANQTVSALYINGVRQKAGTYGSSLSGATYINNDRFYGNKLLTVSSGTRNPIIPNEINERNEGNGLNNN